MDTVLKELDTKLKERYKVFSIGSDKIAEDAGLAEKFINGIPPEYFPVWMTQDNRIVYIQKRLIQLRKTGTLPRITTTRRGPSKGWKKNTLLHFQQQLIQGESNGSQDQQS